FLYPCDRGCDAGAGRQSRTRPWGSAVVHGPDVPARVVLPRRLQAVPDAVGRGHGRDLVGNWSVPRTPRYRTAPADPIALLPRAPGSSAQPRAHMLGVGRDGITVPSRARLAG